MCGIAGIIRKDGRAPDRAALLAMGDALTHRGPDGTGDFTRGPVGFGHTRLAIIDVDGGDQPLTGPGEITLIGNGEIYNYVELRAEQEGKVAHRTRSDFEPSLSMLEADGLDAVERLRGMYAFAVDRPGPDDVLLARDPFGIKPLYVTETDEYCAFASEPQALFAAGLATPALSRAKAVEFLQLHYTTGRDTVFDGVRRVMPGEALRLSDGAVTETALHDAIPEPPPAPPADLDAALDEFDTVLQDSVAVHQRSDVPYGMFLSGGLDSAAVLTMMARLNDRPVRTFTCGFTGTGVHDERPAAARVAEAFGAEHTEIDVSEEDFWTLLPKIAATFDEPTADYAIVPTYKLGEAAQKSVKVVLSGEGGDEVLAGYGRYRKLFLPWFLGGKSPRSKGKFVGLGVLRDGARTWAKGLDTIRAEARRPDWSKLQAAQATDIRGWLHADLLLKLDRALMAHSVEGRTPFLDPVMARFAFHLPDRFKIAENQGKYVLRHWLARHCPSAGAFERKRGFTVPVGEWIVRRGEEIGPLVAARPAIGELCKPGTVEPLFRSRKKRARLAAWTLLFYALWHRHHIEGAGPAGDVFEALAA